MFGHKVDCYSFAKKTGLQIMFNLSNFKKYAGISASDLSDDSLIVGTIAPAARSVIAGMLATEKVTPRSASGVVQVQRAPGNNNPITITNLHRFISPEGLRYKPTDAENTLIPADKAEQNISCKALETGDQYNSASGPLLSSIPAIPDAKILSLGFSQGRSDFELPEKAQIKLAVFYLSLFYYENRNFLKEKLKPSVLSIVTGLIGSSRDVSKFIPQPGAGAL